MCPLLFWIFYYIINSYIQSSLLPWEIVTIVNPFFGYLNSVSLSSCARLSCLFQWAVKHYFLLSSPHLIFFCPSIPEFALDPYPCVFFDIPVSNNFLIKNDFMKNLLLSLSIFEFYLACSCYYNWAENLWGKMPSSAKRTTGASLSGEVWNIRMWWIGIIERLLISDQPFASPTIQRVWELWLSYLFRSYLTFSPPP